MTIAVDLGRKATKPTNQPRTARGMKYYSAHLVAELLHQSVLSNILDFHTLSGCDTVSSFSSIGNKTCLKMFNKNPHPLPGIGSGDNVQPALSDHSKLDKKILMTNGSLMKV